MKKARKASKPVATVATKIVNKEKKAAKAVTNDKGVAASDLLGNVIRPGGKPDSEPAKTQSGHRQVATSVPVNSNRHSAPKMPRKWSNSGSISH